MDMAQERAVGIVPIYKDGDQYLFCLVHHSKGHWGFPKGHQEVGESDEQTALRELKEETGVTDVKMVEGVSFTEEYLFERDGVPIKKTNVYFLAMVGAKMSDTDPGFRDEIMECVWLPYEKATQRITFEESKRILDEAWEYRYSSFKNATLRNS